MMDNNNGCKKCKWYRKKKNKKCVWAKNNDGSFNEPQDHLPNGHCSKYEELKKGAEAEEKKT